MTPKPQAPKPEALPEVYPDVEPGDHVYVRHPERGPMAVRVLATGKHGLTATCPMGDLYRVHWERILGVKARMNRKFKLVDNGAEGCILEDDQGQRRYVAHAEDEGDDEPDPKPKPKTKKIAKAFPDHARALFLKTFIQGYVKKDGTVVQAHTDKRHPARVAARITEKLGGTVIGNAMPKDIVPVTGLNLLGKTVSSPAELAAICQAYRNPLYETMRFFFVRNGRVVGQCGISARLPGTTDPPADFERGINAQTERLKAEHVWLVHNHPSGDPTPSDTDKRTTETFFRDRIRAFAGHVIIDHDRYSAWTEPGGWAENVPLKAAPMPKIGGDDGDGERIGPYDLADDPQFSTPSSWLLKPVGRADSTATIAELAAKSRDERAAVIVSMTERDLKIRAISQYPVAMLSDPNRSSFPDWLPDAQRDHVQRKNKYRLTLLHMLAIQTGATHGMALFCDHRNLSDVFWLYRFGIMKDIITTDEAGAIHLATQDHPPTARHADGDINVIGHQQSIWVNPIHAKEVERFFEGMGYPPPRIGFPP